MVAAANRQEEFAENEGAAVDTPAVAAEQPESDVNEMPAFVTKKGSSLRKRHPRPRKPNRKPLSGIEPAVSARVANES